MDDNNLILLTTLSVVALLIFGLNIPFGYWRATTLKFSTQWFMAVHIPIPFVVFLRIQSNIGFIWYSYPLFIGAFFLGQRLGASIQKRNKKRHKKQCIITVNQ